VLLLARAANDRSQVPQALERYRAATGALTTKSQDREVSKEIVRQGINDLHRLRPQPLTEPRAELGLGYLHAVESGTDPAG
jgi:hypothetical protein